MSLVANLPRAHGPAPIRARLRATPDDFVVTERLGFAPSGSGEHVWVDIEKVGANTEFVARALARIVGIDVANVGFAGLKDRHARTRQSFTLHLPGRPTPALSEPIDGVTVRNITRHHLKLKRGAHRGNAFVITLRELSGELAAINERLAAIRTHGVPNYFGSQRFGHDEQNLDEARALFRNPKRRLPRAKESIYLSAARSAIFNAVLAQRVISGSWNHGLDGEVYMLAGSQSIFGPEARSAELDARLAAHDIHPTGPLWGAGSLKPTGDAAALELAIATTMNELADGLAARGLRHERRAQRLLLEDFRAHVEPDALRLEFALPAGCFATTVVRELAEIVE
jgi:tRNA pseudouridine13 synthase